jgi:hypothetical protein
MQLVTHVFILFAFLTFALSAPTAIPTFGAVRSNAAANTTTNTTTTASDNSTSSQLPSSSAVSSSSSAIPTPSAPIAATVNNNSASLNKTNQMSGMDESNQTQLLLPDDDPFYRAPNNTADYNPGEIIRYRKVQSPGYFTNLNGNISATYQVLFRSADNFDEATAAVTTVLVPHNANVTKLLSYQNIMDSSATKCGPSYTLRLSEASQPLEIVESTFLQAALNEGWVVNVPDYEGPEAAFAVGKQSGQTTLDSIRAVLNLGDMTGIKEPPTISLWGFSGGTIGTVWAAELQDSYAPELNIAGAASGGITPNLTEISIRMNNSTHVGIVFSALHGLSAQYPEFKKVIEDDLYPEKKEDYMKGKDMCIDEVVYYNQQDWTTYFKSGIELLEHPVIQNIMKENEMGKSTPKIPMFWYDGPQDDIGDYNSITKLMDDYCADGASILLHEDLTARHTPLAVLGSKDAFAWLKNIMDGIGMKDGCRKESFLSNALTPGSMDVFGEQLGDRLVQMYPQIEQNQGNTALD